MAYVAKLPRVCGKNKIPREEYLKLQREYWQAYRRQPDVAAKLRARKKSPEANRRKHLSRLSRGLKRRDERIHDRKVRAAEQGVPYMLRGEPPCPAACEMCQQPFAKEPHSSCATLDRKVPDLGYVPDNVGWICLGCNGWKARRTLVDAQALAATDSRAVLLVAYLTRGARYSSAREERISTNQHFAGEIS